MFQNSNLNFQFKEQKKKWAKKTQSQKKERKIEEKVKMIKLGNRAIVEKMNKSKIYFWKWLIQVINFSSVFFKKFRSLKLSLFKMKKGTLLQIPQSLNG